MHDMIRMYLVLEDLAERPTVGLVVFYDEREDCHCRKLMVGLVGFEYRC